MLFQNGQDQILVLHISFQPNLKLFTTFGLEIIDELIHLFGAHQGDMAVPVVHNYKFCVPHFNLKRFCDIGSDLFRHDRCIYTLYGGKFVGIEICECSIKPAKFIFVF